MKIITYTANGFLDFKNTTTFVFRAPPNSSSPEGYDWHQEVGGIDDSLVKQRKDLYKKLENLKQAVNAGIPTQMPEQTIGGGKYLFQCLQEGLTTEKTNDTEAKKQAYRVLKILGKLGLNVDKFYPGDSVKIEGGFFIVTRKRGGKEERYNLVGGVSSSTSPEISPKKSVTRPKPQEESSPTITSKPQAYVKGKMGLEKLLQSMSSTFDAVEKDLDGDGLIGRYGLAGLLDMNHREGTQELLSDPNFKGKQVLIKQGLDSLHGRGGTPEQIDKNHKLNNFLNIFTIVASAAMGSPDVPLFSIRTGIIMHLGRSIGIDEASRFATWAEAVAKGDTTASFGSNEAQTYMLDFDQVVNLSRAQLANIDTKALTPQEKDAMARAAQATIDTYIDYHYADDITKIKRDSFNILERMFDSNYDEFREAKSLLDNNRKALKSAREGQAVLPINQIKEMVKAMCLIQDVARKEFRADYYETYNDPETGYQKAGKSLVAPNFREFVEGQGMTLEQASQLSSAEYEKLRDDFATAEKEAEKRQKAALGPHRNGYVVLGNFWGGLTLRATYKRDQDRFEYTFEGMNDEEYPVTVEKNGTIHASIPSYSQEKVQEILNNLNGTKTIQTFENGGWKKHLQKGFEGQQAGLEALDRGTKLTHAQMTEQEIIEKGSASVKTAVDLLSLSGYKNIVELFNTHKNRMPQDIKRDFENALKASEEKNTVTLPQNVLRWCALYADLRFPTGKAWSDTFEFPVTSNMIESLNPDSGSTNGGSSNLPKKPTPGPGSAGIGKISPPATGAGSLIP